jgi:preprotein translocase subunit SecG
MQVRGQGASLFGSAEGSFRTRRGIEKTLFQFTIALVVLFIVFSILSVRNF